MAMDEKRKRLAALGSEILADALLEVAENDDHAMNIVIRLTSTSDQNRKRIVKNISKLVRSKKFYDWREAEILATRLDDILDDIEAFVLEPEEGIGFLSAFFESDRAVLESCDDSNGIVGDVYGYSACRLFVEYAKQCTDKHFVIETLLTTVLGDEYGTRSGLIKHANEFLNEKELRKVVDLLWELCSKSGDDHFETWWITTKIEPLARQLKDAPLFEKAAKLTDPGLSSRTIQSIAAVYLESGDAETAYSWIMRITEKENFRAIDRDLLLLEILRELGNAEEMTKVAWSIFHRGRNNKSLELLLSIIGEDRKSEVMKKELESILNVERFSLDSAYFLVMVGELDSAEEYLVRNAGSLDGDSYTVLLPIAKVLEDEDWLVGATVAYRALLGSILDRAVSKYYHHGVRYLKKLDKLAAEISDWKQVEDHESFKNQIVEKHFRKKSFWSKYGEIR